MTYDIENRMLTAGGKTYRYTQSGQRIYMNSGPTQEIYYYGVDGRKLGTYQRAININYVSFTTLNKNVYFNGRLIVSNNQVVVTDPLGSVWANGATGSRFNYYPYGEEYTTTGQDGDKYATYYGDAATNLQYAKNRYYSSAMARFLTPDPYRASGGPVDPASWNRYAYVGNDPVNFNDQNGTTRWIVTEGICTVGGGTENSPYENVDCFGFTFWSPAQVAPPTGGGAPRPKKERQLGIIGISFRRLQGLLKQDDDCVNFLASKMDRQTFNALMNGMFPLIGPGELPEGVNAQQGPIGSGYDITINSEGAFFTSKVGVGYADKHVSDMNRLQSGHLSGQIFILLHEIAHFFNAPKFIEEGNDPLHTNSKRNNDLLWDKCSKTLNATIPQNI